MAFKNPDFFQIEELYTSEEILIRDTVRAFVEEEFLPIVEQHHRAGTFPVDLIPRLGSLGLLGASLTGYGASGLGPTAYGLVLQELEKGDTGLRSFVSVQGSLAMYPIWKYGTETQKNQYLPDMVTGKIVGCFGLTEPDFGSNPGGMLTKAVKTD